MIKKINTDQVLPIRRAALYPDRTLEDVRVDGDENAVHFAYCVDHKIVSVISVFPGNPYQLRKFATLPEYQHRGYGTRLMRAVLSQYRVPFILNARTHVVEFYKTFGFKTTDTTFTMNNIDYCVMERSKSKPYDANPFPYSFDNKRYRTYNYFAQTTYGCKAFKVGLDAGFTCPNRDGTCGSGGCNFCSDRGSGDMILKSPNLEAQVKHSESILRHKWPDAACIAYFQAYSNTHDSLENLMKLYTPFFNDPRFIGIDIATRSDCLDNDKIAYFKEMSKLKDLTIEIGLQSIHEETGIWMNRGHDLQSVTWAINALKEAGIRTCIHIINGFPNETEAMMLDTIDYVAKLHPEMVKIHMLHIIRGTKLAAQYKVNPFTCMTQEDYVSIVAKQIERLPSDITIARVTGDGLSDDLIAPEWTKRKIAVTNDIDKQLVALNTWQGKKIKEH